MPDNSTLFTPPADHSRLGLQKSYVNGWMAGQLQAISNLIASQQQILVAHDQHDAWQALQEASYSVNRALTALDSGMHG